MANTLTNVLPVILAKGVLALRQNAIMAQLVNRDLQGKAQEKGDTVNVPIPSAIAARAVTPAVTFAANVDGAPTKAAVTLDQWFEAPMQVSDSDTAAIDIDQFFRMQGSEAIKALGNNVDSAIMSKHTGFYGFAGTPGTTPFNGSLTVAATARQRLSMQLAPLSDRRAVINPDAEAMLIVQPNILDTDKRGDQGGILEASVGRKLGFDWYMDQNITSYTVGTAAKLGYIASTVTGVLGQTTLNTINASASGQLKVGDIFTWVVDGAQHVITVTTTISLTVQSVITFYPPLAANYAVGATFNFVATSYVVNLAFHRDAWAFASRPLLGVLSAGNQFQAPVDPVSGIALRLELSRQYKQETLSFDVLYGTNVIRRELGAKIAG